VASTVALAEVTVKVTVGTMAVTVVPAGMPVPVTRSPTEMPVRDPVTMAVVVELRTAVVVATGAEKGYGMILGVVTPGSTGIC